MDKSITTKKICNLSMLKYWNDTALLLKISNAKTEKRKNRL